MCAPAAGEHQHAGVGPFHGPEICLKTFLGHGVVQMSDVFTGRPFLPPRIDIRPMKPTGVVFRITKIIDFVPGLAQSRDNFGLIRVSPTGGDIDSGHRQYFFAKITIFRLTLSEGNKDVTMIDEILQYNRRFVAEKGYEPYITDKYPAKKLAVLTCMDTRLTELLPKALGLKNGDAKIIKNAGGLILSETDSAIRSLLVGIYELGVREVMVVHHSTCGACHMSYDAFRPHMLEHGISEETLAAWEAKGVADWLEGFHDTEASVRKTVAAIVNHPLVPKDVVVRGFIIDSVTGALTEIE